MKFKLTLAALALVAMVPAALAQVISKAPPKPTMIMPDLVVREYQFAPTNNKALRVHVYNAGQKNAGASTLRLTVRKINGVAVGRTIDSPVAAVSATQGQWVTIDTTNLIPNDVSLKDTTFKINLDVTKAVAESKEDNNEKWHNLNP